MQTETITPVIDITEVLWYFEDGSLPTDDNQEKITAEIIGLHKIEWEKMKDNPEYCLKAHYFDVAVTKLNHLGITSNDLRILTNICTLIKMSRKYRDAKEPEALNSDVHIAEPPKFIVRDIKPSRSTNVRKPKGMDWEVWRGAFLHALPEHFKFGTDIVGSGVEEIL